MSAYKHSPCVFLHSAKCLEQKERGPTEEGQRKRQHGSKAWQSYGRNRRITVARTPGGTPGSTPGSRTRHNSGGRDGQRVRAVVIGLDVRVAQRLVEARYDRLDFEWGLASEGIGVNVPWAKGWRATTKQGFNVPVAMSTDCWNRSCSNRMKPVRTR